MHSMFHHLFINLELYCIEVIFEGFFVTKIKKKTMITISENENEESKINWGKNFP